jgi:NADH-quinone oxidoreductase subunit J
VTYDIVFAIASALAVASALGVVLSGNPFYSALSLIMNLVALATLYLLLQADFLAAAQVIVYAGAVMIMFLFVIAYLGGRADEPTRDVPLWQLGAAVVAGGAIVIEIVVAVATQAFDQPQPVSDQFGSPQELSVSFFSTYLLAFEATSILLLVAAVGGVVLGSRRPSPRVDEPDAFPDRQPVPAELALQAAVMGAETGFPVTHVPPAQSEAIEEHEG